MRLHSGRHSDERRGFVLLAVLIVVVLLSLAAYQFSELAVAESRAQGKILHASETRLAAQSGVHYCMALLATPDTIAESLSGNPYSNPTAFRQIGVNTDGNSGRTLLFSVIAVDDVAASTDGSYGSRYGVTDETSKININALIEIDATGEALHDALIKLPNATEDVVNAIVDWVDSDSTPRMGGAEDEYYNQLQPAYSVKNGPLDSVEELLMVKGMTPELLYGNDNVRNGRPDGETTTGLDRGWMPYLTVYSRETNFDANGAPRINLNDSDLAGLYTKLKTSFSQPVADFVLAYRLYSLDSNPTAEPGDGQELAPPEAVTEKVQKQLLRLNLRLRKINSVYDLVGARVTYNGSSLTQAPDKNGRTPQVAFLVPSPFNPETGDADELAYFWDQTTETIDVNVPARVNINTAPPAVLATLPGLTTSDVEDIINTRATLSEYDSSATASISPTWLLTEVGLSPEKMKALDKYITARSQVYRVQAFGFSDGPGPIVRIEAVIDTNLGTPRIVLYRDLTELGRAYDVRNE